MFNALSEVNVWKPASVTRTLLKQQNERDYLKTMDDE
jgi:hypothetical protein